MGDRELLELAAKAAGIDVWTDIDGNLYAGDHESRWNPLEDDGDALRLAVEIGLSIYIEPFRVGVPTSGEVVWEEVVLDGFAATRRAIVRAAADIGKDMQ
jgi:hypothetical protein